MTVNAITPPSTIGFIGLGNMGYPMAKRLCEAGFKLVVADLNQDTVNRFCSENSGLAATNLADLGRQSRAVITMLPDGKAVRNVLMAADGVVSGLQNGSVLLDMSSCSPVDTLVLAQQLKDLGFPLIDAPVSGGVVKAVSGGLAIMAGGDADTISALRPLLDPLGKVFLTGGSGSGHAMKAINNFLSATTMAITSEAVIAGEKFGLDPKTMVDIINASTGRSNSSEHKFPTFVLPRTFNSGFFLGLMAKDLRFAKALVDSVHTPNIFVDAISKLYDDAEAKLGPMADNIDIHRYLEALASKD
jgi:3-hydroxyisobutyrate dehydrogenase